MKYMLIVFAVPAILLLIHTLQLKRYNAKKYFKIEPETDYDLKTLDMDGHHGSHSAVWLEPKRGRKSPERGKRL